MESSEKDSHEKFAERLDYFITANYESRSQFSAAIGVPQTTVSSIFSKRASSPSKEFFVRLRKHHPECDLNWLITGERGSHLRYTIPENVEKSKKSDTVKVSNNLEEKLSEIVELFKTGIKVRLD